MDPVRALAAAAKQVVQGDLEGARAACERVLERHPERTDALELRCIVALEEGDHATALEVVDRALAVEETAKRHVARARATTGLGRFDDAKQAISRALVLDPSDPTIYEAEAAMHVAQGEHEAALESARGALALAPDRVCARGIEAAALHALERTEEALDVYRMAVRARDGDAKTRRSVLTDMIVVLEAAGETDEVAMARMLVEKLEGV